MGASLCTVKNESGGSLPRLQPVSKQWGRSRVMSFRGADAPPLEKTKIWEK